ncbi:protein FAM136A-like [Dermatophagoides pteronyssinus]|uniref:Uncharacterized protein n=2 Tax=Dermatophagoides pteronyssinus TaxID=6956 RepID=A0ABQ8IZ02_DERPT|nr:protein FAM136A-like [Dermatophagoides pteronyssinus]KAH9415320.1 hypothetical protein DERP_012616 [Dermatophagoides pteronyssinus]KAH9417551.1 hypothetical protein DERP_014871 [Dermatophagoides pteronyssinus]
MAEEAQKRVQTEVNKFLTNLDQTCLRKMQVQMFQCSAKCCENNQASMEQVASCVEDCSSKFRKAQSYISNEMSGFLKRLERCALQCQDQIHDQMNADTTDDQMKRYETQFESCVIRCADDTIKVMPDLFRKIKGIIDKEAYHKA